MRTQTTAPTVWDAFAQTSQALEQVGVTDVSIEAEVLVRLAARMNRSQYFANLREPLTEDQSRALDGFVRRRVASEPLAYIAGEREFYGLSIRVDSRVLIPRQETELLVDLALEFLDTKRSMVERRDGSQASTVVADICTGSGAVAVAIAANAPNVRVMATDLSADAVEVAAANVAKHSLGDQVKLSTGDLFDAVPGAVDVVVSNPPYVPSDMWDGLPNEVKMEPRQALIGGEDGLDVWNRLLKQGVDRLSPGGAMFVELMPDQIDGAVVTARELYDDASIGSIRDFSGDPRILTIHRRG